MKEENKLILPLEDGMTHQGFMERYYRLPQLCREDAKIELLA
jgi:hypothetical protein